MYPSAEFMTFNRIGDGTQSLPTTLNCSDEDIDNANITKDPFCANRYKTVYIKKKESLQGIVWVFPPRALTFIRPNMVP